MKQLFQKRTIAILATVILLNCLFAFTFSAQKTANVEMEQGLYVFYKSKPIDDFEYLGTVKHKGMVSSYKPEDVLPGLIKRVKRDYPKANGIIVGINMDVCDAIQFKE